jgi:hypothetical protein
MIESQIVRELFTQYSVFAYIGNTIMTSELADVDVGGSDSRSDVNGKYQAGT